MDMAELRTAGFVNAIKGSQTILEFDAHCSYMKLRSRPFDHGYLRLLDNGGRKAGLFAQYIEV